MFTLQSYNVAPNAGDNSSSLFPIGSMISYAGAIAPAGWLNCDGSAISRTVYASLFALIGVTFGAGNNSTTFNLPNTAGKTVRGVGSGSYTLGNSGGADAVTLATNQLAPHSHELYRGGVLALSGGTGDWSGTPNVDSGIAGSGNLYNPLAAAGSGTLTVQYNGTGQQPVSLVNPYVTVNYIIKY